MDRYTDEGADPNDRNERSSWLMELFKHIYAGRMFGTQAEPSIGILVTEQYAPLPTDKRQANAGLQHYVPGLSYTQWQVNALSRKFGLGYAPHVLVGAAGAGRSTTDRGLVFQQVKVGKVPSQLPRYVGFARATIADFERRLRQIADNPRISTVDKMSNVDVNAYVKSGGIRTIDAMIYDVATQLIGLDELFDQ